MQGCFGYLSMNLAKCLLEYLQRPTAKNCICCACIAQDCGDDHAVNDQVAWSEAPRINSITLL